MIELTLNTDINTSRIHSRGKATRYDSSERGLQFGNLFATIVSQNVSSRKWIVGNESGGNGRCAERLKI